MSFLLFDPRFFFFLEKRGGGKLTLFLSTFSHTKKNSDSRHRTTEGKGWGVESKIREWLEGHPAFVVTERKNDGLDGGTGGGDSGDDDEGSSDGDGKGGGGGVILGNRFKGVIAKAAHRAHKSGRRDRDKDSKRLSAAFVKMQAQQEAAAAERAAREGGRGVTAGCGDGASRVWVSLSPAYLAARTESDRARAKEKGKAPMGSK